MKRTKAKRQKCEHPFIPDYLELLNRVVSNIESLISEIEYETINNNLKRPPQEIIFDVVPMLKKLKEAKKEAQQSLLIYGND